MEASWILFHGTCGTYFWREVDFLHFCYCWSPLCPLLHYYYHLESKLVTLYLSYQFVHVPTLALITLHSTDWCTAHVSHSSLYAQFLHMACPQYTVTELLGSDWMTLQSRWCSSDSGKRVLEGSVGYPRKAVVMFSDTKGRWYVTVIWGVCSAQPIWPYIVALLKGGNEGGHNSYSYNNGNTMFLL